MSTIASVTIKTHLADFVGEVRGSITVAALTVKTMDAQFSGVSNLMFIKEAFTGEEYQPFFPLSSHLGHFLKYAPEYLISHNLNHPSNLEGKTFSIK